MTQLYQQERLYPDNTVKGSTYRSWERQAPPYVKPLPFHFVYEQQDGGGSNVFGDVTYYHGVLPPDISNTHNANRAYDSIVSQLGDKSQWGNNLIEASESVGTIERRAGQLISALGALKSGNVAKAAKVLATPVPKSLKGTKAKAKSLGDQWLELHFGWVPAMEDIHSATGAMTKADFGSRRIEANSGSHTTSQTQVHTPDRTELQTWSQTSRVKCGITTRVVNPNAFLANSLGVLNPASILWEAVPYSFVVDWFSNVGAVLSSMTDFVGIEVLNPYTTSSKRSRGTYVFQSIQYPLARTVGNSEFFEVIRQPIFSGPTIEVKPFKGFSATRGATAISLLLQHL